MRSSYKAKLCSIMGTGIILIMNSASASETSNLDNFYLNFKQGHYQKAVEVLEKTDADKADGVKSYLLGLSYSRLQEYDKAIVHFEKAIKEKNSNKDIQYEYGQALYAANEIKKAREAFKSSAAIPYNRTASLYYVAHISQMLEEYETAKDNYLLVLKDKDADKKMKQITQFQLSESLLSIAREKTPNAADLSRRVDKYILPIMKTAYKIDLSTQVAFDINNRITELMDEFGLDPDKMANGRRLNPKRYTISVSQKMKFDNNITLTNEENNVLQTQKESYIFETEAYGKYDFAIKKRFIVSPEMRLIFTEHSDQNSPEVFTNDSFVLNSALKNKYEHIALGRPASLLFDIDYSRTYKDWHQEHSRDLYSNSYTFTLGEGFSYFNFGDTTLRLKRKEYKGENQDINNHTTSFSVDQTAFLPIQHLVIFLFDASFVDNYNNPVTNTNTYLTRIDYLIPEVIPTWTLDIALATTITDTKEQEASRGTEFTLNPSLDFSKDVGKFTKIGFNYDFIKNNSKSPVYDYSKSVVSTELRFTF
jgi:tetratricopeptide (TPR) repeat protein